MKTFSINIMEYWIWKLYRWNTILSKHNPKWHIFHALDELYSLYHDFAKVTDVEVTTTEYIDSDEGNYEEKVEKKYSWSGSDEESFIWFQASILYPQTNL